MPRHLSLKLLVLVVLGFAAESRAARLLQASDFADAPVTTSPSPVLAPEVEPFPAFGIHFAKTVGFSFLGSAAGYGLAVGLGTLSNSLIWAALPVLLSHLVIGPVVTALAAMLLGNIGEPGRFGFWGPLGVAFVLHAIQFVVSSLVLAVPWMSPLTLFVYCLVDAVIMTGGSVGLMHILARRPNAMTMQSLAPNVADTQYVSMMKVSF